MSGTLRLRGSTSGYAELQAAAVAGDQTFILPAAGGTLLTTDSPIGNLTLELGSASAPSLRFEGDTDTGLFSSGANTLNLVTGGSNKLVLGATSHTIFSGTNGSVRALDIDSSGNVAVAMTSNVQGKLSVFSGTDFSTASQGGNDNIYLVSDATSGDNVYGASIAFSRVQYPDRRAAAIASVQTTADEDQVGLAFFTHPSTDAAAAIVEAMRVEHSGSVLIGTETSNANDRLTILDPGDSFVSIRSTAAADATSQILDFAVGTGDRASTNLTGTIQAVIHSQSGGTLKSDLKFYTNAGNNITQQMVIKDTGSVGINTLIPAAKLHTVGTVLHEGDVEIRPENTGGEGGQITLKNPDKTSTGATIDVSSTDAFRIFQLNNNSVMELGQLSGTGGVVKLATAGSTRLYIDGNGNVGVGNTAPGYKLSVLTTGTADRVLNLATTGGADANGDATNSIYFTGGTATRWANAKYEAFNHIFHGNGVERMRILSGGGVTFNGDTAQANALDDYEEGSCIMGLSNATTAPTFTNAPANTVGYYVKIGNMCTVSWYTSSFRVASNGSGVAVITGLPFTVANLNNYYPIPSIAHANCFTSDVENGYSGYNTSIVVPLAEDGITGVQWKTDGTFTYLMFSITYRTV